MTAGTLTWSGGGSHCWLHALGSSSQGMNVTYQADGIIHTSLDEACQFFFAVVSPSNLTRGCQPHLSHSRCHRARSTAGRFLLPTPFLSSGANFPPGIFLEIARIPRQMPSISSHDSPLPLSSSPLRLWPHRLRLLIPTPSLAWRPRRRRERCRAGWFRWRRKLLLCDRSSPRSTDDRDE